MNHPFTHRGQQRQLVKHPAMIARHRRGEISDPALAAAPWYFRMTVGGRDVLRSLGTSSATDAVRRARLRLAQATDRDPFEVLLEASKIRQSATFATLAADWVAAQCPHAGGAVRTPDQVERLRPFLDAALRWWGPRAVATVRPRDIEAFAAHKRGSAPAGSTGERAADLELATLSSLCRWAVQAERCDRNPFDSRPRFRRAESVQHCHQAMPASDEDLHRLLGWLMASPDRNRVVAGAQLAFCALTGLRPGEPGALLRAPRMAAARPEPGARYDVTIQGITTRRMAVQREKAGQNLAVAIHPALSDFLAAWDRWLLDNLPSATYLFPNPEVPDRPLIPFAGARASRLRNDLDAACRAVGLDKIHAHGMRAYYVRCRRSAGADDLTIAVELGQSSGGSLIRSTYGDGRDVVGDGRFDWLPEADVPVAWTRLGSAAPAGNVVALEQQALAVGSK